MQNRSQSMQLLLCLSLFAIPADDAMAQQGQSSNSKPYDGAMTCGGALQWANPCSAKFTGKTITITGNAGSSDGPCAASGAVFSCTIKGRTTGNSRTITFDSASKTVFDFHDALKTASFDANFDATGDAPCGQPSQLMTSF